MKKKKISHKLLEQAQPIIIDIASRNKKSGSFAHYTPEDIEQEVWTLCLDALQRYNRKLGELENFLRKHVSNRLKNLKRDKYFRPDGSTLSNGLASVKINLVNALPLGGGDVPENGKVIASSSHVADPIDILLAHELQDHIINNLPPPLINIFFGVINGNRVRKVDLQRLRNCVKKILAMD